MPPGRRVRPRSAGAKFGPNRRKVGFWGRGWADFSAPAIKKGLGGLVGGAAGDALTRELAHGIQEVSKKIIIPGYTFLPTRNNRRIHQTNRKIECILGTLIEKRMKAMQEGESTKDDLLDLMLHSNMTATNENSQSIPGMTIEEVIEECKLFYFAGSKTTSVLLTWTMIVLSMHPEWQYRARNEILGIFGKNKPEYENFGRLKMVTMILYEVLWLYPSAITFIRKTCKDMKNGGITYAGGVLIELLVLFIHHDLEIWGSDVLEFNPERFAEGIFKASKDASAFIPFGWGPRVCIG
ncbi:cytochrome P450 CYP72A616-like [Aegilops tauschii subsp. strangulata]|uniref:Secologanin synthase n=1 Tax=Aegilops tauschii TaxID=37682 RepID=M8AH91_AEGTA